ncbi:hypothetical protein LCGC14_2054520 [marine sediment metagenome]|uniref:MaoC-like domain-containing protein n=1 Tax=marine sediment metagenome TaxID=412755 RepID=A0A0F9HK04_9ZZZZ
MYIEELHDRIGDSSLFNYRFTTERVEWFAELTMDNNPLHLDKEYAATTRFEKPVVHGMLVASMFSKIFGTQFPGEGTVYSTQQLEFINPVYHEDFVCATVKLREIVDNIAIFETTAEVYIPGGVRPVITGEAEIWLPSMKYKPQEFEHSPERDEKVFKEIEEKYNTIFQPDDTVLELLSIAKKWRAKAQMREAKIKELELDAKRWRVFSDLWDQMTAPWC